MGFGWEIFWLYLNRLKAACWKLYCAVSSMSSRDICKSRQGSKGESIAKGGVGIEELPTDIICLILSKLPLKSLTMVSCVCKRWLDIIENPFFAELHASVLEAKTLELMMAFSRYRERSVISITALSYKDGTVLIETPTRHIVTSLAWKFVGACNGVLCFVAVNNDLGDMVMICNPVTREHIFLPYAPAVDEIPFYDRHFGFGFDVVSKNYKVIRVLEPCQSTTAIAAQVCTLGRNSSWRKVEVGVETCKFGIRSIYANGWVYWSNDTRCDEIICFDMDKEDFKAVPTPQSNLQGLLHMSGDTFLVIDLSKTTCAKVWKLEKENSGRWKCDRCIDVSRPQLLGMHDLTLLLSKVTVGSKCTYFGFLLVRDARRTFEERICSSKDADLNGFPYVNWESYGEYKSSLLRLNELGSVSPDKVPLLSILTDAQMRSLPGISI